jgi:anti-sigma factor RsiW
MNQHLSRERISELLIEPQRDDEKEHLVSCAACNAELAELRAAISMFGEAARNWGELQDSRELQLTPRLERKRQWWSGSRAGWGLVAAIVLLVFVWAPIHRKHDSQQAATLNAENDAILMQQIDSEVSRRVPAAMDPIAKLISEDTNSTNGPTDTQAKSQTNGEKR